MIRIALTGSIAMGKSTVAKMFAEAGVPVFNADAVVRELQSPGSAYLARIGALFPGAIRDGRLDRDTLAHIVLAEPDKLAALEVLMHPAVREAREQFIAAHAKAPALLLGELDIVLKTARDPFSDEVDQIVIDDRAQFDRLCRFVEMFMPERAKDVAIHAVRNHMGSAPARFEQQPLPHLLALYDDRSCEQLNHVVRQIDWRSRAEERRSPAGAVRREPRPHRSPAVRLRIRRRLAEDECWAPARGR